MPKAKVVEKKANREAVVTLARILFVGANDLDVVDCFEAAEDFLERGARYLATGEISSGEEDEEDNDR